MRLLLVDGTNVAYRWHKNPAIMLDNYPKTVISLAKSFKTDAMLVSFDNKGSSFRKEILEEYKSHRGKNLSEEELQHRKNFYEIVNQVPLLLAKHDVPAVALERVETDDIIAWLCLQIQDKVEEIIIVSSDKDLYQLLTWANVKIFSLQSQKWMDQKTFISNYGIDPAQWVDVKSMMGDTGDNIPGIYLVGEKRALAYITNYGPTYDDVLINLKKKKKLGKIDKTVLESKELVDRNRRLIDLKAHAEEILPEEYKEALLFFMEEEGITL